MAERRALVTGSTRGIGEAVVEALAEAGFDLVLSAREADALKTQATAVAARHDVRTAVVPSDLSQRAEVERLAVEGLSAFDGLEVLVNNAGVSFPEAVTDLSGDHWSLTIEVNLTAACLLAARVGRSMADAGHGKIINVASAAGLRPLRDHYAYCVSKAGLVMATRVLALELGPFGVRANVICPTVVLTEMGQRVWGPPEKATPMLSRIPAGRFADPRDVTGAVLFLTSPAADMINGVELPVDGGYLVS
jgi:NAD(P)-dependent dehydrogenase (short-subunit alcohol dehydrogenase family)